MANSAIKITDTTKRVVYKFTGDGPETNVLKIEAAGLNYAMNVANTGVHNGVAADKKPQYRLSLKRIMWSVVGPGANGAVELKSDGAVNNTIVYLTGSGQMNFSEGGDTFTSDVIAATNTLANGNVLISTIGFIASQNSAYTIFADFRKDPKDYSQGQFQDPTSLGYNLR